MRVSRILWVLGFIVAGFAMLAARGAIAQSEMRLVVEGKGTITILLYTKDAPKTTEHIIDLVKKGFYDGQKFHRVLKTPRPFLVQIGAPSSRTKPMDDPDLLKEGSGTTIPYEDSGHSNNAVGIVGLGHPTGDQNSGDSQFYILLAPAPFLDGNHYTVFGKVVQGLDVLKKIEKGDTVTSATLVPKL